MVEFFYSIYYRFFVRLQKQQVKRGNGTGPSTMKAAAAAAAAAPTTVATAVAMNVPLVPLRW